MANDVKVHHKVGEAEGGDVCACGWWGPSQGEHEEVLASEPYVPRGKADVPTPEPDPDHINDPELTDIRIGERKRLHRADGSEVDYERAPGGYRKVEGSDTRDNPGLAERRRAEDQAVEDRLAAARKEREERTNRAREESAKKPPGDVHDLRRGRWYDEKPITNAGSTSGGTGMASSEEVRAAAMAAVEKMNEALGAAQQAGAALEESQGMFMQASEGSGKASAAEANGLLAQAVNDAQQVGQQIAAAIAAAEEFANQQ